MRFKFFARALASAFFLATVSTSVIAGTTIIDVKKMASEVQLIVKNRAKLSCIELTVGLLKAQGLTAIATSKSVIANSSTKKLARKVGKSATSSIEREEKCHCDRGAAMIGYEIFERRAHLQKNKKNKRVNKKLKELYPKDSKGKPRFLIIGEKLDDSILAKLPKPSKNKRFDDCNRSCKKARKRTNAAAVAAGKPEPYPNLGYPRKKQCR